ncbi:YfcC family protein [Blautia producta]|uniref:YfcC family protein n=1 Tax=Blautia producta TaxID=33035 RepID=UPI0031B5FCF2
MVLADSFHYIDSVPVNPLKMFVFIVEAFLSSADIIFCILFAYCFIGTLIDCKVFDTVFGMVIRILKDRRKLLLPVVMLTFGLMGSVAGLAEETFGMFPICISLVLAMGYDRIVGGAIVYLAVFTGFAAGTFNPFTIGVAQTIAEVPMYSGLGFRVLCFVIFMSILIMYVMKYSSKIYIHQEESLMFGEEAEVFKMEEVSFRLSFRQKLSLMVLLGVFTLIVIGAIRWGWYITEIAGLFLAGDILLGIINKWSPNKIADKLVEIGSGTMFSMMIIGFSNAISNIMSQGKIVDTVVHGLASLVQGTSGQISAFLMLLIQNLLNFFIPSGPGQAAVSMPIMSSLADVTGLSRQVAVLTFQFGDGFSNIFWPTMVCMMCGIMKIPVGKWYRFVSPLFGIMFAAQVILTFLAVACGY